MKRKSRYSRRKRLRHECLAARAMLTASPWTNPLNPLDVTGEGEVSSRDALNIINQLSRVADAGTNKLADLISPPILGHSTSRHYDTTGDGELSARDALRIINRLGQDDPPASSTVLPEQSDSFDETAHALALADDFVTAEGELVDNDDRDVFRFQASRGRTAINLSSIEAEEMATVRVLDSNLNEVGRDSYHRGRTEYEGFDFETEPGEDYFVVVESDQQINDFYYAIDVYQYESEQWVLANDSNAGVDVYGDSIAEAAPLALVDGFARVSSHIDLGQDQDVFAVTTQSSRVSFEVFGVIPEDFETAIKITDADGVTIPPIRLLAGATVIATEPGETIYATISGVGSQAGQYSLDVHEFDRDSAREDQDGDTIETASLIQFSDPGVEIYRSIDSPSDVDVFQFHTPVTEPAQAFLSVGGYGDFVAADFEVLDADGVVVDTTSGGIFSESDWMVLFDVDQDADYFVRVFEPDGNTGEYLLTLGFVGQEFGDAIGPQEDSSIGTDIHSDLLSEATLLELAGDGKTRISHIDYAGDVDVFQIPVSRNSITVTVSGAGMTYEVIGSDGAAIEAFSNLNFGEWNSGGEYAVDDLSHVFVRVSGQGSMAGRYYLEYLERDVENTNSEVDFDPDSVLGDDIHGGAIEDATLLTTAGSTLALRSHIDLTDDVDVFRIPITESSFVVETLGESVRLEVYDDQQTLLTPMDKVGPDDTIVSGRYETETSGFVYAKVYGANGALGLYELRFFEGDQADVVGNALVTSTDADIRDQTLTLSQPLDSAGDVDVYRIPNALPGSILVHGIPNIEVEVYDEHGRQLRKTDPAIALGRDLDAGQYSTTINSNESDFLFVRVFSASSDVGDYSGSFLLEGVPTEVPDFDPFDPYADLFEPDSEFGEDPHASEAATRLRYSEPVVTSFIDSSDDVDVFKIVAYGLSNATFALRSDSVSDLQFTVFDEAGEVLEPDFTSGGDNLSDVGTISSGDTVGFGFLHENLVKNEEVQDNGSVVSIFVHVSSQGSTGMYTLFQSVSYDANISSDGSRSIFGVDDHGETLGQATSIEVPFFVPSTFVSYMDNPIDRDVFQFTATDSDLLIALGVRVFPEGAADGFSLEVFDANGNAIENEHLSRDSALAGLFQASNVEVGSEYYVVVSSLTQSNVGRYALQFNPLISRIQFE